MRRALLRACAARCIACTDADAAMAFRISHDIPARWEASITKALPNTLNRLLDQL